MPLRGFYCSDGKTVDKLDCYKECRNLVKSNGNLLPQRCRSLKYLVTVGNDYPWRGKPSVTQLINPTRMSYLKITEDYYIEPNDRAFAVLGSWSHSKLDIFGKKHDLISELKLDWEISGILDALEPDETNPECYKIIDHKTWGSYAVAKPKQREATLQLNYYKYLVENNEQLAKALGKPIKISQLLVECIIRDGDTWIANKRNVDNKVCFIPLPIVDTAEITTFFNKKKEDLLYYLDKKELPPMCSYEERWKGKMCSKFCDVRLICPAGRQVNSKKLNGTNIITDKKRLDIK
jgi:hypothetical protein